MDWCSVQMKEGVRGNLGEMAGAVGASGESDPPPRREQDVRSPPGGGAGGADHGAHASDRPSFRVAVPGGGPLREDARLGFGLLVLTRVGGASA
ncbi:hypothetical protein [Micromonospora aurantiaca (nom. illeg.)]|uniref:hypothetical protein n=1 Tax=Micromonospora aurantiaca (nom. illeg.) TaxID=47850 RepID=UPI0035B4B76C